MKLSPLSPQNPRRQTSVLVWYHIHEAPLYVGLFNDDDKLHTRGSKEKEYEVTVCSGLSKGGQLNGISNSSWEVSVQVTESPMSSRGRVCGESFDTFILLEIVTQ